MLLMCVALSSLLLSQEPVLPAVKHNFTTVTSYDEMWSFLQSLDNRSDLLTVNIIGQSVNGKNLYGLMFSSSRFGNDKSKIRVLIFAQQHGNEQSGKEGALLLASELIKPENRYLFDKIDLALVPQVNPDGSTFNQRRNAHTMDLNRNHLILTEPETRALHALFDEYLFEVTMDVHEYSPYSDSWETYGYRKDFDVTIGSTTNPIVSGKIRELSDNQYLPYIFSYLMERGFSSFVYCPGGPPGVSYIRHSTFDINDGRQSLGIQNTFSFIQEGMNGTDSFLENLQHRAEGQMTGMQGLLEYVYLNGDRIKTMVASERKELISAAAGQKVSIQSEHMPNGQKLSLPLVNYRTGKDTMVIVEDYRPVVRSTHDVTRPVGYLIPRESAELIGWVQRQSLITHPFKAKKNQKIEQYGITSIDSIDFEGDIIVNPEVEVKEMKEGISSSDYLFIPVSQLKCNLIILALEPKSMLGLVTYPQYARLLMKGENYPVLRIVPK
ncbi:MAG TPA: M14 family zinc carboxypeptidase [Bacteroidales bacterium]|nr:M14 family zinc carboxypeptidase [Bacteroidales bacterium]